MISFYAVCLFAHCHHHHHWTYRQHCIAQNVQPLLFLLLLLLLLLLLVQLIQKYKLLRMRISYCLCYMVSKLVQLDTTVSESTMDLCNYFCVLCFIGFVCFRQEREQKNRLFRILLLQVLTSFLLRQLLNKCPIHVKMYNFYLYISLCSSESSRQIEAHHIINKKRVICIIRIIRLIRPEGVNNVIMKNNMKIMLLNNI